MALDGIGRGGAPVAPIRSVEVDARAATKTFQVPREGGAVGPTAGVAGPLPTPPSALERLRAGDIDRDGYLDLKVHEATAHLEGLRPEDLDAVRAVLRGQLESEPALMHLVSQAMGKD